MLTESKNIILQIMSGSKIGAKLYKIMEMGELVPTVRIEKKSLFGYLMLKFFNLTDSCIGPLGRSYD